MALVVVGSAKAAPGVTTLTVALAALCPGPTVAADLDSEGGDLALRYRAPDGGPLNPEVGLLSLAASLRGDSTSGRSFRAPEPVSDPLPAHLQMTAGGLGVLLGVNGPDQAVGLGPLWSPLARALADAPATVFADCGRIGAASPAMPVVREADAVILIARAEVEELAHLRDRLRYLGTALAGRFSGPTRLGVVLITGERDRAAGPRTEQLLRSSGVAVPVLGTVADDPKGAARLRGVGGGRADRTTLIRSVRALVPQVAALAGLTGAPAPAPLPPPVVPAAADPATGPSTLLPTRPPHAIPAPLPAPAEPAAPPAVPPAVPPAAPPAVPSADPEPGARSGRRAAHAPAEPDDLGTEPDDARPVSGGERWREVETPPGGTGWPSEPAAGHDPYGVSPRPAGFADTGSHPVHDGPPPAEPGDHEASYSRAGAERRP